MVSCFQNVPFMHFYILYFQSFIKLERCKRCFLTLFQSKKINFRLNCFYLAEVLTRTLTILLSIKNERSSVIKRNVFHFYSLKFLKFSFFIFFLPERLFRNIPARRSKRNWNLKGNRDRKIPTSSIRRGVYLYGSLYLYYDVACAAHCAIKT